MPEERIVIHENKAATSAQNIIFNNTSSRHSFEEKTNRTSRRIKLDEINSVAGLI